MVRLAPDRGERCSLPDPAWNDIADLVAQVKHAPGESARGDPASGGRMIDILEAWAATVRSICTRERAHLTAYLVGSRDQAVTWQLEGPHTSAQNTCPGQAQDS